VHDVKTINGGSVINYEYPSLFSIESVGPVSLTGASSVVYNDSLWIFGGNSNNGYSNSIYRYNFISKTWSIIPVSTGQIPTYRNGHTAVLYHNSMIIFGGANSNNNIYNDLWQYFFDNNTWISLPTKPSPRCDHTAVIYDDRYMLLYGGVNGNTLNDLWRYDIIKQTWTSLTPNQARSSHSAIIYKRFMIIYGGNNYGDVYRYDIDNDLWTTLATGPFQTAHTAVLYHGMMYVYGGINPRPLQVYDIMSNTWTTRTISNGMLANKYSHTAALYDDSIYYYGPDNQLYRQQLLSQAKLNIRNIVSINSSNNVMYSAIFGSSDGLVVINNVSVNTFSINCSVIKMIGGSSLDISNVIVDGTSSFLYATLSTFYIDPKISNISISNMNVQSTGLFISGDCKCYD
jgi:hypothetical protein